MHDLTKVNRYIKEFNYISPYFKYLSKKSTSSCKYFSYVSIDTFMSNYKASNQNFNTFIYKKISDSSFKNEVELYKNANIDRKRWSDLINNRSKQPDKDLLFKLAISLKLKIIDTDTLLMTKGYCIDARYERDIIITYFIMNSDGRKILNLNSYDRNIKIYSILKEKNKMPLYYQ